MARTRGTTIRRTWTPAGIGLTVAAALAVAACGGGTGDTPESEKEATMDRLASRGVESGVFGQTDTGDQIDLYTLRNANGIELRAITYGAIIVSLEVADRDGEFDDIVLGYEAIDGYRADSPYFGAIVGRYGNRIARGRFELDGRVYRLATNNGPNHLHGGDLGFDKAVWDAEPFDDAGGVGVSFHHVSPDGDEGYPGTMEANVRYTLTDRDEVVIDYLATSDRTTHVNLTQHTYFNLAGAASGQDILGHELQINASRFTPVDSTLIPTGELASVEGTPFDFVTPTGIGERIGGDDIQLVHGGGYDHNFVLDREGDEMVLAARLTEASSGRVLDVFTSEPGVQFYSGNFLDGSIVGKEGKRYERRSGLCLETQHFPDSPNRPEFPPTVLQPGQEYRSRTVWAFSVAVAGEAASPAPAMGEPE